MLQDEGYIKYSITWQDAELPAACNTDDILHFRNRLHELQFIGENADGIGYGNISKRYGSDNTFIITGTQTGRISLAQKNDLSLVTQFDIANNSLLCSGKIKASSEALTHAAFYTADKNIHAVIHVHHADMWQSLKDQVPTTDKDVAYGTPQMANEIFRLYSQPETVLQKIIITAGHQDGIFTFGKDLQEAWDVLMHFASANYY